MTNTQRAYETARRLILDGTWPSGTIVSEAELGQRLGLSRTPIHAAFLQLEAERLLTIRRGVGAVVPVVDARTARDMVEVRLALEAAAARRLVQRDDAAEVVALLEACIDRQQRAVEAQDEGRFTDEDSRFHDLVIKAAGNDIAQEIYAKLSDRIHLLRRQTLAYGLTPEMALVSQHRTLVADLRSNDTAAYERHLSAHLSSHIAVV